MKLFHVHITCKHVHAGNISSSYNDITNCGIGEIKVFIIIAQVSNIMVELKLASYV